MLAQKPLRINRAKTWFSAFVYGESACPEWDVSG